MPDIRIGGVRLHYTLDGDGPETLVFVHGLMLASESWERQVAHFAGRYRVLTFDLRGQGRSEHPRAGLDLDNLAADTAELIHTLGLGPCHLVGFSMGTFVALRVAARRPELVRTLTLIGPSAEAEEPANLPRYRLLIGLVKAIGPAPFTRPLMKILFGDTFLKDPARRAEAERWRGYLRRLPRALARAAAASAGRRGVEAELAWIRAPTLVVSGDEDRPISPTRARAVHAGIPGSRFVAVPATGHAVMIERPARFNALLEGHISGAAT
ncbi:MAG TPA: alpha/beta hydrolase [Brevundimonas sp.]|jgi:pimeloyl-ACP methyl ester carboxylesterase|uniref:alpha/beta fold hydrolase n=1 Tax=Brevundimonas sp. TaxID=1871086 RepID=UPI002E15D8A9|nr:alpha/beta hydrolase [Brevundimonas sp.]